MTSTRRGEESGFTLIELVVALLILAIVLAATAPALYSTLKATSTSNLRSVANGIAVQADEQMRSLPYYQIGYSTGHVPGGCSGTSPVTLGQPGPMETSSLFPPTQTADTKVFSILRCAYWINADGDTGAYMVTTVKVTWTDQSGTQSVTQSSAIYPGGESAYSAAKNSFPPETVPSTAGTAPTQPGAPTPGTIRSGSVALSWTAPSTATKSTNYTYLVEYNTTGTFNSSPSGLYATVSTTSTSATVSGLAPGSTYSFQIVAVNQGTPSPVSTIQTVTTAGTPDTSGTCTIYGMTVNPTQAQINTLGFLQGQSFFTVGMNASPGCSNGNSSVYAYFPTSSSTLQSVQMSGSGPMLTAAAGLNTDGSQMAWTPGNKTFTAYTANGSSTPTAYTPSTFVQINVCQPSPVTGSC